MEQLLTKIGELVSMEIDEVKDVEYLDKEMGYMFYINLEDGRKVLLSLVDSQKLKKDRIRGLFVFLKNFGRFAPKITKYL